ncbi:Cell division protein FtsI (Penicillin-binding protein 3) [Candidatus Electronema halotolerans]
MRRRQNEYSRSAAAANRPAARQQSGKHRLCCLLFVLLAAAGLGLLRQFLYFLNDGSQPARQPAAADQLKENASALPALRGTIYDRHLHEMAVSYQLFSLQAHPEELADRQAEAEKLALIIGTGKDMLLQQMQGGDTVVELAGNLSQKQAAEAAALHLPGIRLQSAEARCYPGHAAAGHLLGFVSEGIGLSGVEARCDSLLQPGEFRKAEAPGIDFAGQESLGATAADIILTIDFTLQKKLEQRISAYRQAVEAASASALVLNMDSGELLAAVRQPSFDPNYFWKSKEDSILFPQIFSPDLLRPLLAQAAAVRETGTVAAVPPDVVSPPDHGLRQEELTANWQKFGFDQTASEPELASPAVPLQKTEPQKEDAKLSAIQMAAGAAALFNNGKRLKLWLLKAVYDPDHERLFQHDPDAATPQRIIPPAVGVLLRQNLLHHSRWSHEQGFLFGNRIVFAEPVRNGLQQQRVQELLLLAAPRENPRLLLLLALDYGRLEPPPFAGDAEEEAAQQPEDLGRSLLALLTDYAKEKDSPLQKPPKEKNETNMRRFFLSRQLSLPSAEEEKAADSSGGRIMPDLKGLSLRKGLQRLNSCKLKIQIRGSGKIRRQHPAAGTSLEKIDRCTLILRPEPIKRLRPTPKRKVR